MGRLRAGRKDGVGKLEQGAGASFQKLMEPRAKPSSNVCTTLFGFYHPVRQPKIGRMKLRS